MRNPLSTTALAVVAFAAVALGAAACGGGGSHGSASSAGAVAHLGTTTTRAGTAHTSSTGVGSSAGPPNAAQRGADALKFTSCMRAHGVPNFPTPVISNNGKSMTIQITPAIAGSPDLKSAQAACQHLLPVKPTAPNITPAEQADYLKAARCMRAHGINGFPDPDFSGGGVRFNLPPNMNPNSQQFAAARHICQNLIPNGLPYSASSENS